LNDPVARDVIPMKPESFSILLTLLGEPRSSADASTGA